MSDDSDYKAGYMDAAQDVAKYLTMKRELTKLNRRQSDKLAEIASARKILAEIERDLDDVEFEIKELQKDINDAEKLLMEIGDAKPGL